MAAMDALDNVVWHTLTGVQSRFAEGEGAARRYARGFSAILGFADLVAPDFGALVPYCASGEQFYCLDWQSPAPPGWRIDADDRLMLMVGGPEAGGAADAGLSGIVRLGGAHVALAMALAERTRPGPFGPRTIELGDYFGIFDGCELVAMAGERMEAGAFREISGVCTDPAYQGRGFARALVAHLARRQRGRGQRSFLHVMAANAGARSLYESLGFECRREIHVRVVTRI